MGSRSTPLTGDALMYGDIRRCVRNAGGIPTLTLMTTDLFHYATLQFRHRRAGQ
ncbi:hypothetical protein HCH_00519 [Hahella chejuensis KCTC 2396]|uniref:Uncharacterized protein n=1 Tax=Hahella chejuensis (strain KCTC 2396) TaxID=349521 RepID=Q2SPK0_HAHCH|nr:hypothetical protein HCH_00519 [Hahella chejuensis KCTC 2396]